MGTPSRDQAPSAEVTDELVHALLEEQFPDLAKQEVGRHYRHERHIGVRIGDHTGLIFPTDAEIAATFPSAARAIEQPARRWGFPAGVPVHVGQPNDAYPYHWYVTSWIQGSSASVVPLSRAAVADLARALKQIHILAPSDAPPSATTSAPLNTFSSEWESLMEQARSARGPLDERFDLDILSSMWVAGTRAAPPSRLHWTHGYISPMSILTDRGAFAGITDWFGFGAGDRAADLAAASLLVPSDNITDGRATYGRLDDEFEARLFGFRSLYILRYALSPNPFFSRYGWSRAGDAATFPDVPHGARSGA